MKLVICQLLSLCLFLSVSTVQANEPLIIYRLEKPDYRLEIESLPELPSDTKGSAEGPNMIQYLGPTEHVFDKFFPGVVVETNSEWSNQVIRMTIYADEIELTPGLKNQILSDLADNGQGVIRIEESLKDIYCLSVVDTKLYNKSIFKNNRGTVKSSSSGPDYLELKGYSLMEIADKLSEQNGSQYIYKGDADDKLKVDLDTHDPESIAESFAEAGVMSSICQKDLKKIIL